eukprot:scaffold124583_cov30-Tisochrysis_lutea.AAC.3
MLAFTGCSFEVRQCVLEQSDESLYDAAVDFWEDLLQGLEKAVEIVGRDPSSLFRLYWGAHQSFFKQVRLLFNHVGAPADCQVPNDPSPAMPRSMPYIALLTCLRTPPIFTAPQLHESALCDSRS